MLTIFSYASWPSVCFLWRNVYLGLPPVFWLGCFFMLSCVSYLYILEINHLSVALFTNIFSHSGGCLFVLFMVSFALQKLISLIRSYLSIFLFIFISKGSESKRVLLWFMSKCVLPVFSSKSFIVSGLTFRSLIHFEFVFVHGVRVCSNFILLHTPIQFSQHHLFQETFAPLYILASRVKDKVPMGMCIYLWTFYFVLLICISVFVPIPYCLDWQ